MDSIEYEFLDTVEYILNEFQFNHGANLLYRFLPMELPTEYQRSVSNVTCFDEMITWNMFMQVDSFLIQTRGHPLNITAHGFFPLDNTLTFSVRKKLFRFPFLVSSIQQIVSFQALTTLAGYLLILIQFQLAKTRTLYQDQNSVLKSV